MDEFSELEQRFDAFCTKTRAFLGELGELALAQHPLRESLAEIRTCLEALRRMEQANGKIDQRCQAHVKLAGTSAAPRSADC